MVDLMAQYEQHGFALDGRELRSSAAVSGIPCAVAEKRSVRGLQDVAPILALLSARLQQRDSRYAVLFDLLLKLANTVIDGDKVAEKLRMKRDDTTGVGCGLGRRVGEILRRSRVAVRKSPLTSVVLPVPWRRNI